MPKVTASQRWQDAIARLNASEEEAGVRSQLREMHEKASIRGTDYSHEERKIIFSIADVNLRKRIIQQHREVDALFDIAQVEEARTLSTRLQDGGRRLRNSGLLGALVFGVVAVLIGNKVYNQVGAIIGAVVALLVGFEWILRVDREVIATAQDTAVQLEGQRAFIQERSGDEGLFTESEALSGQAD